MHIVKRPLSKHRRARLIASALAMLAWMASVLFAGAPFQPRHERQRHKGMSLAAMTHMVKLLIVSRAGDFAQQRRPKRLIFRRHGRSLLRPSLLRALVGARVRRALRHKHIGKRIAALIDALLHIDSWAHLVAKRMRRGLSKRWPILPAPIAATPMLALAASESVFADTS